MKCRSCGLEIAEKAIVCYRCGTPTAEPRVPAPVPARGLSRTGWLVLSAVLAIVALVLWVMPVTSAPAPAHWSAAAVLVAAGAALIAALRRRRVARDRRTR